MHVCEPYLVQARLNALTAAAKNTWQMWQTSVNTHTHTHGHACTQDRTMHPAVGTQTNHFPSPDALMNSKLWIDQIKKAHPNLDCGTLLTIVVWLNFKWGLLFQLVINSMAHPVSSIQRETNQQLHKNQKPFFHCNNQPIVFNTWPLKYGYVIVTETTWSLEAKKKKKKSLSSLKKSALIMIKDTIGCLIITAKYN